MVATVINDAWHRDRNDRSLRYAGRVLPPDRPILLRLSAAYGARYDGQVAAITGANLLARMTPSVAFDVPDIDVVSTLPWAGRKLRDLLLEIASNADPYGEFSGRAPCEGDYVLSLGPESSSATVHGSGWNAFVGAAASPVPESNEINPVGPAFAVIAVVTRLFARELQPMDGPHHFNAFHWQNYILPAGSVPRLDPTSGFGSIWAVGLGSVGTAALYFLTLATRRFTPALFDMDPVKVLNLDRSPIFSAADAKALRNKAKVTEAYLRSIGMTNVKSEPHALDEAETWRYRQVGTPDLLIAAANERNVRYSVEQSAPPLQIYGTTGANWEASVIRHIPMADPCSCCLFPPGDPRPVTVCASHDRVNPSTGETIDASLPFLSFAAGLMAAAEILKTSLPDYPFSSNRATLYTHPDAHLRFISPPLAYRPGCICNSRSSSVHAQMIAGTKHAHLSAVSELKKTA